MGPRKDGSLTLAITLAFAPPLFHRPCCIWSFFCRDRSDNPASTHHEPTAPRDESPSGKRPEDQYFSPRFTSFFHYFSAFQFFSHFCFSRKKNRHNNHNFSGNFTLPFLIFSVFYHYSPILVFSQFSPFSTLPPRRFSTIFLQPVWFFLFFSFLLFAAIDRIIRCPHPMSQLLHRTREPTGKTGGPLEPWADASTCNRKKQLTPKRGTDTHQPTHRTMRQN